MRNAINYIERIYGIFHDVTSAIAKFSRLTKEWNIPYRYMRNTINCIVRMYGIFHEVTSAIANFSRSAKEWNIPYM